MCTLMHHDKSLKSKCAAIKSKKPSPVSISNDSLQTRIQFDIDESRKRRSDLENDVNELIKISKYFQKHYADDFLIVDSSPKRNKEQNNRIKATEQEITIAGTAETTTAKQNWSCVTAKERNKKQNNGKSKIGTEVKANAAVKQASGNGLRETEIPPLYDKEKLSVYYSDLVEDFFQNNVRSKEGSPPRKSNTTASNGKRMIKSAVNTIKKTEFIRSRSASAGRTCRSLRHEEGKALLSARGSLMNEKSKAIIAKVERSGADIKKHSCIPSEVAHRRVNRSPVRKKPLNKQTSSRCNSFQQIHPNIELVQTSSIFPKRVLKKAPCDICNGLSKNPSKTSVQESETKTQMGEQYGKSSWHDVLSNRSDANVSKKSPLPISSGSRKSPVTNANDAKVVPATRYVCFS